jgi:hypothetical protein
MAEHNGPYPLWAIPEQVIREVRIYSVEYNPGRSPMEFIVILLLFSIYRAVFDNSDSRGISDEEGVPVESATGLEANPSPAFLTGGDPDTARVAEPYSLRLFGVQSFVQAEWENLVIIPSLSRYTRIARPGRVGKSGRITAFERREPVVSSGGVVSSHWPGEPRSKDR